jgi:very-short-patch-repair endonuclease
MVNFKKMAYLGKTIEHHSFYNAKEGIIDLSRKLRKRMTPGEKILWKKLRRKKINGVRIRRQHPIEYFIADFYCHEARLVIEVDGLIHISKERKDYDLNRNAEMDRLGIKVIRFSDWDVKNNMTQVIATINDEISKRLKQ